jgi:23S rRNA (uracil1939-C5)-methyltransferase
LDELVLPTLASPKQWYYRNRIQLHVDSKGRIGFYKSKSKEVVEFDECLIADERLNEQLKQRRLPPPSPSSIPSTSLRAGKGEGNVTPSPLVLARRLCGGGEGWGEGDRPHIKGFSLRLEEGPSFSQINTEQNERLKKVLTEWLSEVPHDSIMELYAGAGNFTFPVASVAKKIIASDIDGQAIHYARLRQQKEGMGNIEFICAPAHDAAKKFHGPCDIVLIDPPRKGCAESIDVIVGLKPGSILYISCDPATLARDIKSFCEFGYKLKRCLPVDMFPQTYHIESVSLLQRSKEGQ